MVNTEADSAARPPRIDVFTPPSTSHVASSPYTSRPLGDAGLNPPALNPRLVDAYTVTRESGRKDTATCGETFEKPRDAFTCVGGAIVGVKNVERSPSFDS